MTNNQDKKNILIIGGTGDARKLCSQFYDKGHHTILCLRGVSERPLLPKGVVRIGGFGHDDIMQNFIKQWQTDFIIDASHPFATNITARLLRLSKNLSLPLYIFRRPTWQAQKNDQWTYVDTINDAMKLVCEQASRPFFTTGISHVKLLQNLSCDFLLIRSISPQPQNMVLNTPHKWIKSPPLCARDEKKLMCDYKIDMLIAKESGGNASMGKIIAAQELNIPIILIRQPRIDIGNCPQAQFFHSPSFFNEFL